jgi:hypothetical protein
MIAGMTITHGAALVNRCSCAPSDGGSDTGRATGSAAVILS